MSCWCCRYISKRRVWHYFDNMIKLPNLSEGQKTFPFTTNCTFIHLSSCQSCMSPQPGWTFIAAVHFLSANLLSPRRISLQTVPSAQCFHGLIAEVVWWSWIESDNCRHRGYIFWFYETCFLTAAHIYLLSHLSNISTGIKTHKLQIHNTFLFWCFTVYCNIKWHTKDHIYFFDIIKIDNILKMVDLTPLWTNWTWYLCMF